MLELRARGAPDPLRFFVSAKGSPCTVVEQRQSLSAACVYEVEKEPVPSEVLSGGFSGPLMVSEASDDVFFRWLVIFSMPESMAKNEAFRKREGPLMRADASLSEFYPYDSSEAKLDIPITSLGSKEGDWLLNDKFPDRTFEEEALKWVNFTTKEFERINDVPGKEHSFFLSQPGLAALVTIVVDRLRKHLRPARAISGNLKAT